MREGARAALPPGAVGVALVTIALSGNPSVYALAGSSDVVFAVAAVVAAGALAATGRALDAGALGGLAAGIVGLVLAQALDFGFVPVVSLLGLLTRVFLGAAVVALVRDFPVAYVRAMRVIALYALGMYALDQSTLALGVDARDLFTPLEQVVGLDADHRFSLVYTFTVLDGTHRAAAFFREPGLYAGYLLLALLFLQLRADAFAPAERQRLLALFVVSVATTFSTAGYVTLPLVLVVTGLRRLARREVSGLRLAAIAITLGAAVLWLVSTNVDFLAEKILHQYEVLLDEGRGFEITRFGAALLDLQAVSERPLTGWGIHESTKFALTPELAELSPSGGVTGWLRSFGLVGLVLLTLRLWRGARALTGEHGVASAYVVLLVVLIAQPNTFLNFPLFMCLLFLDGPRAPAGDASRAAQVDEQAVAAVGEVERARDDVIDARPVQGA